ncbi:Chromate resistance protein ChrB [Microbacterium sp. CJ88]|uniref:Chromate resistance protein ChrB n=1 Tax=Microbacterium sp. CJ88 TaxID=3445672 RepID=UPI003F6601B5
MTDTPDGNDDASPTARNGVWLLLVYRVPSEPTRLRATVWRRLKGLGAVYVQNSVVALPANTRNERALRKLRHEIIEMAGAAVLLDASAIAGESTIRELYDAARTDEYEEILDRCRDFLAGLQKEYANDHFTYAELEENEVDLVKLQSWFEKVSERDAFGAPGRERTTEAIAECATELEAYASRVYAVEGQSAGGD